MSPCSTRNSPSPPAYVYTHTISIAHYPKNQPFVTDHFTFTLSIYKTPVSMAPMLIHDNPRRFPYPRIFIPDHWLDRDDKPNNRLQKYLIPFGRGLRQCAGINLAYVELYVPYRCCSICAWSIPFRALRD